MEGLEASIVTAGAFNEDHRFDAQFFQKAYLAEDQALNGHTLSTISEFAFVTDGPHGYHEVDDASPIAMLTAKCVSDWFAEREGADTIARWVDDANKRSSLEVNDLILSTRGTVGNCAVVTFEALPANLDQDVARIAMLENGPFQPLFLLAYLNSRFGQDHIARHSSGMVQQGLSLAKVRDIPVPLLSEPFQVRVSDTIEESLRLRRETRAKHKEAEGTLLEALGLADWEPPEPLSYTARASDAFTASRLDAEHFHPKFAAAFEYMHASDLKITPLERLIEPIRNGVDLREFVENGTAYIRVGDIKGGRIELERCKRVSATKETVKQSIYLQEGDVLFTRKGSFGNAAVVGHNDRNAIISTEIMLLRLHKSIRRQINPDYLAAFFNSSMGKLQAEKWAHGVAFYSVTQKDLYKFEIPLVDSGVQEQIADILGDANRLRDESRRILEAAKRTVEIAIENGEADAMAFLNQAKGQTDGASR